MSADDVLAAIRAREQAASAGPWFWRNTERRNGNVYLQGDLSRIVMAFKRMGMTGAQPMFRGEDGLLYESAEANINDFADAKFIAHARTDVPRMAAALDAVLALCARTDGIGSDYRDWDTVLYPDEVRAAITTALEATA